MASEDARAEDLAARLEAVGLAPRLEDRGDHTRIETEVPESVTHEQWQALLAVIQAADWGGHLVSQRKGQSAWAGVYKKAPGARDTTAAPGRRRQLDRS